MDIANLLEVILLGIVEGITEFLPISSTGHLLIMQQWMARRSDAFNVVIQLGAISAVVVIYWPTLVDLAKNWRQPKQRDLLLKLFAAFVVTCVIGLVVKKPDWFGLPFDELTLPETVQPVAWALIIGAGVIFLAEWMLKGRHGSDDISWTIAILIGVAQMVAGIFPGTSRSGATIFTAMLMGVSRVKATEFSFLVGIPTMFAAGFMEMALLIKDEGWPEGEMLDIGVGFIVSAVVAFVVVKWLLHYVQSNSFVPFAWYRLALGIGLFVVFGGMFGDGMPTVVPDQPAEPVPAETTLVEAQGATWAAK